MSDLKKGKDLGVIADLKTMTNNDKFNWSIQKRDRGPYIALESFSEVTLEKVGLSGITSEKLTH